MPDTVLLGNILLLVVIGVALLGSGVAQKQWRLQRWRKAVKQSGLREVETSTTRIWRKQLTAQSGPLTVRIADARGKGRGVDVEIEGAEGFSLLNLERRLFQLWADEIEIGDKAFDGSFLIREPAWNACALLDGQMRRRITGVGSKCSSLEIGDGRLRAEVSDRILDQVLPILLELARQLAEPLDAERRLARNARYDPEAGVRLRSLLLLVRERPGETETLRALRHACSDKSPEIRLRAAVELGEEGRDTLLKLAESSDDALSAQAISHLGDRLPFDRVRSILFSSLKTGLPLTAHACLEALGHHRSPAVGVLAKVMAEAEGELAAEAARALGATREAAAEAPLLQVLRSEKSGLREAAAAALGHVGTAAAVQPLQDVVERSWIDLSLRTAAREAIAEIQSRLSGASPGQLSLSEGETEAGRLSLASDDAGRLSLAPHAAGDPEHRPERERSVLPAQSSRESSR